MKSLLFLALTLTACGARARVDVAEPPPETTEPTDTKPPPSSSGSGLLRSINEPCAFGAGAGHIVWIDAAMREVNVARAVEGSAARSLGTAAETCALAVVGTRLCFGDVAGSVTCMSVDGAGQEIHGERRAADPVRAIDLGRDRGMIFARRRTVYGRFPYEDTFTSKTTAADIVAVAGDFEPSPDDGVELAVATSTELQRFSYGAMALPIPQPLSVTALHYSAYLVLGSDGVLRTVHASDGVTNELGLSGVGAVIHSDRARGENLVVARDGQIVAMSAQLYFEPSVSRTRVVAPAGGEVVAIALDDDEIVWATRGGEIRRAKRQVE